jgi:hypothetical protein
MKLSEKTNNLLKNFSTINQSILFRKGNTLRTVSVMKNILAEATIEEDIPKNFGIYELSQFLSGISLYKNPEFDFENEGYVVIREGKSRTKFFFADENVIVTPNPDKKVSVEDEIVSFNLETDQLDKLIKASNVYSVPDLSVIGEAGVVKLVVRDKKNDTSNEYSIIVGETDSKFVLNFKVENIKILPGAYEVVIGRKLISSFKSKDMDLVYYIALEPDCEFE